MDRLSSLASRHAATVALGLCGAAALGFGAALDGYSHAQHPLALLGAKGVPHALAFNLLGLVIPGLLVAWTAACLRGVLAGRVAAAPAQPAAAGWTARIGAQMVLLSALAFAAQGLLPLDTEDLENAASARHAAAWMLWWIAFTAGVALLALGLRRMPAWRPVAKTAAIAVFAVPVLALVLPQLLPAGLAQRLAFAAWFAWAIRAGYAVHAISRSAASGPGSSATTSG